jgi:TIR domain
MHAGPASAAPWTILNWQRRIYLDLSVPRSENATIPAPSARCPFRVVQDMTEPKLWPLENELEVAEQSSSRAAKAPRVVFLSYASDDAAAASRICASLRAAGIEVWFDQNELRGGDAWEAAIRRQIKECALFMAVISARAYARVEGYFRLEWKLAVDRSHFMAPD